VKPVRLEELARALGKHHTIERRGPSGPEAPKTIDMAIDHVVLDQIREDLGGSAVREVIEEFLKSSPSLIATLREAAARGDAPAIRAVVHSMKGTSATLGAVALSRRCAELESSSGSGNVADAAAQVAAIETMYAVARKALEAEVA
jgi:two-component system, sensor histidine kinase and response regulator